MNDTAAVGRIHPDFLQGGGEMGARMRALDWAGTPLGAAHRWPQSLRTAVRIVLTSRQPMAVWWGPQLINLYNDAYKDIVGGRHPQALGQPAAEVWREIWHVVGPRAQFALRTNEGTYDEALLLIMERNGYQEETYYTFSYSPVPGDDGGTGGILCANTEDTRRIRGERQLALLRELAARTVNARSLEQACRLSAACLATSRLDVPFAAIYLFDARHQELTLAATSGIARDHSALPQQLALDAVSPWPFAEVVRSQKACLVSQLGKHFRDLPTGTWEHAPGQAIVMPIRPASADARSGVLVAALNPYRLIDADYRSFFDLLAGQIAAALANAQAYEDEHRRADALAEVDRAKTVFFSNVSHEFRTPLTLMLGPIEELLAREEPDRDTRELLAMAQRNGRRLLRLVNNLLDFARVEAGRTEARYAPLPLAELTAELAESFRSSVEKAGLALVVDCAPLPEPVYADHDMWEKMVFNLLSNAYKFTRAGRIEVSLRAARTMAVLSVRDTGIGIPADELPRVFERFHRVQGIEGRSQEGSGIGLALVQELAALHGGSVSVHSIAGAGSTFTIAIPFGHGHLPAERIASADADEAGGPALPDEARWILELPAEEERAAATPDSAAAPTQTQARVLVVDDNADMRTYVRRLLQPQYQVTEASDGREALQRIAQARPDLVLTDVMMPNLDGVSLLQQLRADPATQALPVILLSARAGAEAINGHAAGADAYLQKPFGARELLARVQGQLAIAGLRGAALARECALRAQAEESEQRFRQMADQAPVMVWVTDENTQCTFLSKTWYEFTGQTPETGLGSGWLGAVEPADRAAAQMAFVKANQRRAPFRVEYRFRRHDGEYRWAIDAATPRFAEDGRFLGYVGSVMDITEEKRKEQALRDSERQLREEGERKNEFLATLAHELRNPLAPIRSSLEVLKLAGDNAAIAEEAQRVMERQLKNMVRLVDDLMELSRITRGKIELRQMRVELASVIASAVETSRPLMQKAGHQLEVILPPQPLTLSADPVRLTQVFANLLNNAAKYTEDRGHIVLEVRRDGGAAEVRVRDSGVGIPEEMLPRVFDAFTQIDRTLGRSQGGLGIGLALVRRLVEMHGGTVDARSDGIGRGSEFRVRLPLHDAPAPEQGVAGPAPKPLPFRRVMIVDDNADAANSMGKLLEVLGLEVQVLHSGEDALAAAPGFAPHVAVLDIGMPGMDGCELAGRLRRTAGLEDLVLVALTGWAQPEDRRRVREAGFDHHLVKPTSLDSVLAVLSSV